MYQWDGAQRAEAYAQSVTSLLRRVSVAGTVKYRVVPWIRRDDFLRDPAAVASHAAADPVASWWRLSAPAARVS